MGVKLRFGLLTVGLILASYAFAAPPDVKKDTAAQPAVQQAAPAAAKEPQKPPVKVTISKETTYITEPLRPDGYPDYVAALNQRFSQGVTPENNSAVLFWRAVGPKEISEKHRTKYFEMLGIEPLPEKGDYFVDLYDYVCEKTRASGQGTLSDATSRAIGEQLYQVTGRPWSKEEFPLYAEALAANEKQLALLVEASKRPRRYDPLITADQSVFSILLPGPQAHRSVARALIARAMLRAHEGKIDNAWEDLMACHRMARLLSQGPTLVEALVAITIDGIAVRAERALAEQGKLTSQQLLHMRDDLEKLPPLPNITELIDVGERFIYLDSVLAVAQHGFRRFGILLNQLSNLPHLRVDGNASSNTWPIDFLLKVLVDWNRVVQIGNAWYDRAASACRTPGRIARNHACDVFYTKLQTMNQRGRRWRLMLLLALVNPRMVFSEWAGEASVGLIMPDFRCCVNAEDRCAMDLELTKLAFSLAAYRADHGSYPEKLSELVPKYAKAVPKDIFNDADLHYRRENGGYLLYSVGMNEKDDGGRSIDDHKEGDTEYYDDLVVRVPSKK